MNHTKMINYIKTIIAVTDKGGIDNKSTD